MAWKLNPVVKAFLVLIPSLVISFQYNILLNLLFSALAFLLMIQSKIAIKKWIIAYSLVIIAAIGSFMTGYLYQSETSQYVANPVIANLGFSSSGAYGLELATRIICFASLGMLFSFTTPLYAFVSSLEQQLKLPTKFSYGILAAFNIVPLIPYEYTKVRRAFLARGISPVLFSPRILTPLLIKAVNWSESLAIAMESRGFNEYTKRSRYKVITVKPIDWIFLIVMLAVAIFGTIYLS